MLTLPFTSVVSYHTNPLTCGVAKFSQMLADRLRVPFLPSNGGAGDFPLYSYKWSEVADDPPMPLIVSSICRNRPYGVFWHDAGCDALTKHADVVFYADPALGSPGLWCPSLLNVRPRPVRLFSFGMAHKLQAQHYRRVKARLEAAGLPYHLRVSVGLHEGVSLTDATRSFDALKDALGESHVTILGLLSDEATAEELSQADYVLAFFEQGLRANNTTVHAALDARCTVITNHDDQTPTSLRLLTRDVEYDWLSSMHREYSWEHLIAAMATLCDSSRLAPVR